MEGRRHCFKDQVLQEARCQGFPLWDSHRVRSLSERARVNALEGFSPRFQYNRGLGRDYRSQFRAKGEAFEDNQIQGFECLYAVGKKDPVGQLSLPETISEIEAGLRLNPIKVVLEGRERGRGVGIYDENGEIKWETLRAIASRVDYRDIIFEAPLESQQAALISEFGADVNLGNISLGSVAALQSERLGLRFDTFGVAR